MEEQEQEEAQGERARHRASLEKKKKKKNLLVLLEDLWYRWRRVRLRSSNAARSSSFSLERREVMQGNRIVDKKPFYLFMFRLDKARQGGLNSNWIIVANVRNGWDA
jgi:hypothetical protein